MNDGMSTRASTELVTWMAKTGIPQKGLADAVSARVRRPVCQSTISRALRGATPRGDILSALYAIAGIRIEWWSEPADSHRAA